MISGTVEIRGGRGEREKGVKARVKEFSARYDEKKVMKGKSVGNETGRQFQNVNCAEMERESCIVENCFPIATTPFLSSFLLFLRENVSSISEIYDLFICKIAVANKN